MERIVRTGVSFFKNCYVPHLLFTLLFCLASGGLMSFRNLDERQAAQVMEMYVAFAGILLLTPLFLPEGKREIWQLEKSKEMPMWQLYLPRVLTALAVMAALVSIFPFIMKQGGCTFDYGKLWIGAFVEMLFLGSIGFAVSAVTNQTVLGYMMAVIYYAVNMGGGKYLGKFALFQMMKGSYGFMVPMAVFACILMVGSVLLRER